MEIKLSVESHRSLKKRENDDFNLCLEKSLSSDLLPIVPVLAINLWPLFFHSVQVLMNVLSSRKNMSDSLAYGRLHPQLQPNTLLIDGNFFSEESYKKLCKHGIPVLLASFSTFVTHYVCCNLNKEQP